MAEEEIVFEDVEKEEDLAEDEILVDDEVALEDSLKYDDDEPNLVPIFMESVKGIDAIDELSERVYKDFNNAWEASEEWREDKAQEWKMFSGKLPPKGWPFKGCANVHVPIVLENITRLQFRTMAELFGDWTNVFGVVPVGPDDQQDAEILSKHGNWQIREQIVDFQRQMARATLLFYLNGDVTAHSYYDPFTRKNRHEVLTSDEFVTPYVYCTTMPDYSDCPFVVKILRYSKHELEAYRGIWYDVESVLDRTPSMEDEPDEPLRKAELEVQDIEIPEDIGTNAPYKLLHYEGWLDLPGQQRQRFCQVIMDYYTKRILSLFIYEEQDWQDKVRFQTQTSELERFRETKRIYDEGMAIAKAGEQGALENPNLEPGQRAAMQQELDARPVPMRPVAPGWMLDPEDPEEEPRPVRRVPVHNFSHGVCIEPLTGDKGVGFGRIQTDYNKAANTALSQFVDSATLANIQTNIISDEVEMDRPEEITPGEFIKVRTSGSDIRQSIMPLKYGAANPQLMDLVRECVSWGQSSVQAPSVLSGEAGKSGETFRGLATRVEQATKQLSVATRNLSFFTTQVFKNNAKLNSIFMDDEEIIYVNDHVLGQAEEIRVSRSMYERDYNIVYRSDMKFTAEAAKIQESQQLVQLAMTPMLQQNMAFMQGAMKKLLKAMGQDDMIPTLGPDAPPPQTPMGMPPMGLGMPGAPGAAPPQPGQEPKVPGPGGPPPDMGDMG